MSKNLLLNKYPKILTCVKPGIFIQCRPKVFALVENPKILTSQEALGVLCRKTWFLLRNTPRFWHVLNLGFWYGVRLSPKSLYSLKTSRFWQANRPWVFSVKKDLSKSLSFFFKEYKDFDKSNRSWVFRRPKTWFVWKTPRFWQVLNLVFLFNVCPKILTGVKPGTFYLMYVQNLGVFEEYNRLKKLNRTVVFRCRKSCSHEMLQDFDRCYTKDFDTMSAQNLCTLKKTKILTSQVGHRLLLSKNLVLMNTPRFWQVLHLEFRRM